MQFEFECSGQTYLDPCQSDPPVGGAVLEYGLERPRQVGEGAAPPVIHGFTEAVSKVMVARRQGWFTLEAALNGRGRGCTA